MQKYKVFVNNKPIIISHEWENFISNFQLVVAAGGMLKTKGEKYFLLKEMEYGIFPRVSLKIMNLYLNVLKER